MSHRTKRIVKNKCVKNVQTIINRFNMLNVQVYTV
jgi:hypothetical protein